MGRWAVRHPIPAILAWVLVLVAAFTVAAVAGGGQRDSFALPGTPSQRAQELLQRLEPRDAAPSSSLTIVWQPGQGSATDEATKSAILPLLEELSREPYVTCVQTPFEKSLGSGCPKQLPGSLPDAITAAVSSVLVKETGLTLAQVQDATKALAPIADLAPDRLGTLARALPAAASFARLPEPVRQGIASVAEWIAGVIPGVTSDQVDALTSAFGGVDALAQVPARVLRPLAEADPAALARVAERLPKDVASLERIDRQLVAEIDRLRDAAKAVEEAISPVSRDGRVATATVTIDADALTEEQATAVAERITNARTATLQIGAQGAGIDAAGSGRDNSITVGIFAALIILLIAFGSLTAAALPLIGAGTGLAAGYALTTIASAHMDISTVAPSLAIMIGLGVGTDYALFVLNRFRQGLQSGLDPKPAAEKAVGTAGRAVLFAGSTVVVALLGMFILRIQFFNGLAVAAALTVLMVMLAATWLLPALLSLLGHRALGLRLPWARTLRPFDPERSAWAGFGSFLQRRPIIWVIAALAAVIALALPATQLQQGFPDDGSQPAGSVSRVGYDLLAEGFGAGRGGPFVIAVELPKGRDFAALKQALTALERADSVASTMPTSAMLPLLELDPSILADGGRLTSVVLYPSTAPDDPATAALLTELRENIAPELWEQHKVRIFVGGAQAVSMDFTDTVRSALPLFLAFVIGFGFLALMVLFRSLLIPLTAAVTSLLSFGASLGVTVAVFQLGIGDALLGVSGTGPILPFLPLMVFAILFGLSMDYQVFLVSRMREEWEATGDNRRAVSIGLAGSGRVVVIAASIMTSVFLAFVLSPNSTLKLFGVALAAAVVVDAFLIRLVLVPSLMTMLGRRNWELPTWLGRILPKVTLE